MMMRNYLLAGVGGQGTVLASRLIAQACMERGQFARTAETIGMAQRGGCVVSHVRVGDETLSSLIPPGQAHLLLGFEPGEAVRCLSYLRPDGAAVVAMRPVQPVTASLSGRAYEAEPMLDYLRAHAGRLLLLDGERACREAGSDKALNVALLGAAIGCGALDVSMDEMRATLQKRLPARFLALNLRALEIGADMAR